MSSFLSNIEAFGVLTQYQVQQFWDYLVSESREIAKSVSTSNPKTSKAKVEAAPQKSGETEPKVSASAVASKGASKGERSKGKG